MTALNLAVKAAKANEGKSSASYTPRPPVITPLFLCSMSLLIVVSKDNHVTASSLLKM